MLTPFFASATIIGRARRVQAIWATLVNDTAGVSVEMDEGTLLGGGHLSIHVTLAAPDVALIVRTYLKTVFGADYRPALNYYVSHFLVGR